MDEARARLAKVSAGIAAAAKVAGREPGSVELIAVSKGQSIDSIEGLIAAGQRAFAENRVQEALEKWLPILGRHPDIRLHFVGRLQSNKAEAAVELFDSIHSVDRPALVDALAAATSKLRQSPQVYLQVNVGEEDQKGGCAISDVPAMVAAIRQSELPLAGLMAIPPQGLEPSPYFALLAKLADREGLSGLSMGMSADYRDAVMLGATAVRVGSALFDG